MKGKPHLFICIPAINEFDYIPATLDCMRQQDIKDFSLFICVNQPEAWWDIPGKKNICDNNTMTLKLLSSIKNIPINIIDRSSPGKGWKNKEGGVGWARKTAMDTAIENANDEDILISLDADTIFNKSYFSSVQQAFQKNKKIAALSVPYYHILTGDKRADRAILRYEIYMRNYAMNMWRIGSPYNFTAIGSAMAVPVKAYKAIGGMTPKHSGEDFYFLQKLRKYGPVLNYNPEKVHPAARFSDRVNFGTGPAMIKGDKGDWESYPVYHYSLYDRIKETYNLFPALFHEDIETPLSPFLREVFKTNELWKPLRENFNTESQFIRACHQKIDALRVLQFLKNEQKKITQSDEQNLIDFLRRFYPEEAEKSISSDLSFATSTISTLDALRNFLAIKEEEYQKNENG
jgi:hypothetical protein